VDGLFHQALWPPSPFHQAVCILEHTLRAIFIKRSDFHQAVCTCAASGFIKRSATKVQVSSSGLPQNIFIKRFDRVHVI